MISENRTVKHLFIINPRSFWHKWKQDQIIARIHKLFMSIGKSNYEIHISRFPRDAAGFIPLFVGNNPNNTTLRVYAVGGDGILFDCLNGIMGLENVELAIIPYGRTNNFFRSFGKNERALFRSIPRQYNAPAVPVDVMRCGNNYALSYCAIGVEAEALRLARKMLEQMEKKYSLIQWLSRRLYTGLYFAGAFVAYIDNLLFHRQYRVKVDGDSIDGFYLDISVFNGPYYGGSLHPAPEAVPDDGTLDMILAHGKKFFRTFLLIPFYVTGRYKMFPRVFTYGKCRKISVNSNEPLLVSMDDEVFYESDLTVEVLPAAVKFVDAGRQGYGEDGDVRSR